MKKIYNYFLFAFILAASSAISSCTAGFAEMNDDPRTVTTVPADMLLGRVQAEWIRSGRAWHLFDSQVPWMQYVSPTWGAGSVAGIELKWSWRPGVSNFMLAEFNQMGIYTTTIEMLAERDNRFSNIAQMARITLIAKAIHTSDMQGSIIYTQGWLTRRGQYGEAALNPAFDTQEQLVVIWDNELRAAIQTLKNNMNDPLQVPARGNDRAFAGNTQQWIQAANAIRLRLASRLWNVQPATARAIATDVLAPANAANLFANNADGFSFWNSREFIFSAGDWHSLPDMTTAGANFMDYLISNQDPRKRIFFRENNLTPEVIRQHNLAVLREEIGAGNPFNMIPPNTTRWEGATINIDRRGLSPPPITVLTPAERDAIPRPSQFPDNAAFEAAADAFIATFDWREAEFSYDRRFWMGGVAGRRPASFPQSRIWAGWVNVDGQVGQGNQWIPVMTFADFCFLAAEFVLREGIPSHKTAQQWYETGVRASLEHWRDVAQFVDAIGGRSNPVTDAEITAFLNMPNIVWDPARALEQIYTQTYVEHFRNIDEMYAFWRRTNFPNTTSTIVTFEEITAAGTLLHIPRRARFTYPTPGTPNFDNIVRRFEQMKQDPKFGAIDNEWGRVWWDAPAP